MLAWIYQVAALEDPALEPSFLIGGVAENFGTSFQLRPTHTFIVEGDEYDTAFFDKGPKFLHYFPDALILTHVEFDHADIYADLEPSRPHSSASSISSRAAASSSPTTAAPTSPSVSSHASAASSATASPNR